MSLLFPTVCIVLFISLCQGLVSRLPLQRHWLPSDRIAKGQDSLKTKTSLSTKEFFNHYYVVNISLGTPPQKLSVLVDTKSSTLLVVNKNCTNFLCVSAYSANYQRHRFNGSASETFKDKGEVFASADDGNMGTMAYDVLRISDLKSPLQKFALADLLDGDFVAEPVDGVLGLGWPSQAINKARPPFQSFASQLDRPIFTIWLDHQLPYQTAEMDGALTFGGLETEKCDSVWDYFDLSVEGKWQIQADSFAVGDFSEDGSFQLAVDTSSNMLYGPADQVSSLIAQTGAEYNYEYVSYVVDCDVTNYPDLAFTLGEKLLIVTPREYVSDEKAGNGCLLNVFQQDGSSTIDWVLGGPFLRTYCQAYDFGNKRIGFSRAYHSID